MGAKQLAGACVAAHLDARQGGVCPRRRASTAAWLARRPAPPGRCGASDAWQLSNMLYRFTSRMLAYTSSMSELQRLPARAAVTTLCALTGVELAAIHDVRGASPSPDRQAQSMDRRKTSNRANCMEMQRSSKG